MIIFEEAFLKSKGKPIEYNGQKLQMFGTYPLFARNKDTLLRVVFMETNSMWRQGINFRIDNYFEVNEQVIKRNLVLWEDTSPREIILKCKSKKGELIVVNVWDTGDGVMHSWHAGAAMKVDDIGRKRLYFCNDGHLDDNLNDLVFSIETL